MTDTSVFSAEPSFHDHVEASAAARVLNAVLGGNGVSRTELARRLSMSLHTLTRAVDELEELGVVRSEEQSPTNSPGRRPTLILPKTGTGDGGVVLGMRIEPVGVSDPWTPVANARLTVYLIGLDGHAIAEMGTDVTIRRKRDVLSTATRLVRNATEEATRQGRVPLALGVELGGHVNGAGVAGIARGEVLHSPNLGWDQPFLLAVLLQRATGLVTVVENDVNGLARFERWFGYGRTVDDYVVVMMGDGTGGALFTNGALAHGAKGMAGEIGHNPVASTMEEQDFECWCKRVGCLDAIASGYGIAMRIHKTRTEKRDGLPSDAPEEFRGLEIEAEAADDQSDDLAREVFESAGRAIGRSLAILVNSVDPVRIVLSGKVWWSAQCLRDEAIRVLKDHVFMGIDAVEVVDEGRGAPPTDLADAAEKRWTVTRPLRGERNVIPLFLARRDDAAGSAGVAIAALLERLAGPAQPNGKANPPARRQPSTQLIS